MPPNFGVQVESASFISILETNLWSSIATNCKCQTSRWLEDGMLLRRSSTSNYYAKLGKLLVTCLDRDAVRSECRQTEWVRSRCKLHSSAHPHLYQTMNPRQWRGGGGNATPWVFRKWLTNRWSDHAEILHSLWGVLYATFGKTVCSGQARSRSYDVIRGKTSDRFVKEIVFTAT